MLNKNIAYDHIPFFWSWFFNKGLQYIGHTTSWDEIHVDGDLEKATFIAYYIKNNWVLAVTGMNWIVDITTLKEAMANKVLPSAEEIKNPDFKISSLLSKINLKCNSCKRGG